MTTLTIFTYSNGDTDSKELTTLNYNSYSNRSELVKVEVADIVTTLEDYCFYSCSKLQKVIFGENQYITELPVCCFAYCPQLIADSTTNPIPPNTQFIRDCCFQHCTNIKTLVIPESVETIGINSFDSSSLTSITFSKNANVKSFGQYCFNSNANLTTITIPNKLETLGPGCFANNTILSSVTFDKNSKLTTISDQCFYNCPNLTNLTIPYSVTFVGSSCFYCPYKDKGLQTLTYLNTANISTDTNQGGSLCAPDQYPLTVYFFNTESCDTYSGVYNPSLYPKGSNLICLKNDIAIQTSDELLDFMISPSPENCYLLNSVEIDAGLMSTNVKNLFAINNACTITKSIPYP